ncbi:hemolysin family protein [Pendulispora albinea]|uniref:Hemolysin family protein n=1 Tax=Pendulispora albinea TaxID=2741071 RepID=A0ABZ2M542_9BACT
MTATTEIALEMLVLFGLTLANGFFSGAEIAVVSVRETRLRHLAEQGSGAARAALRLREKPERFLATVQVGITVIGASAGAFGGAVLEEPVAIALRKVGLGAASNQFAFALVVALISVLSIVVGELVPKSLALRSSERVALVVSRPLYLLSRAARPLIWFLTALSNLLLRPFRDQTTFTETRFSPEELRHLVDEAAAAGTVDEQTGKIAVRAIDLGGLRAYSVMIPQNHVVWLSSLATRDEVERTLREQPHARYPILDREQQVLGYVLAHELYRQLLDGAFHLGAITREIPIFPERARAVDVLRTLQQSRSEIGILVDESGAPSGLVSIEILAEELFGEMTAENEAPSIDIAPSSDAPPASPRDGQGTQAFLVRGETPLHQINRELGLEFPIEASASTLGGLVLSAYGGFPARGARVTLPGGVQAEVVEASPRRVLLVRMQLRRAPLS